MPRTDLRVNIYVESCGVTGLLDQEREGLYHGVQRDVRPENY
jgi:hypothetical protein